MTIYWLQGSTSFFANLLKNLLFHKESSGIADDKIREFGHTRCMKETCLTKKLFKHKE